MTPWDVHKNCSPIDGFVYMNKHMPGDFLSLKKFESLTTNERNTYIISSDRIKIGIVQIASRGVRRIDSYVMEQQNIKKGDWIGMVRFGSQVDVILPQQCQIKVSLKQQVYARTTIIAEI